ncbi:uncharacterized protein KY384_003565 [Bacidia gigantensis]|uniref:uncharacterized protein n=1 Tax=Bacidia gigantensis TaxID=2732470 RepID=UPI001D04091C|nr:uncharacterized protein KY384_003565 [Bacidia gigantensis]KAG8531929.1 hypothetical protein KY384_003565 [Bacidia gigantensis]
MNGTKALTEASRYRSITPKTRMIALPAPFLSYLRADGIVLPPEPSRRRRIPEPLTPPPTDDDSDNDSWDDDSPDPSEPWASTHTAIQDLIKGLGGSVMPKLNWSAPKDAVWISATNSMECLTANDIYILLKSSDFVTHDLEQVWDGCEDDLSSDENDYTSTQKEEPIAPYCLVLRKTVPAFNPALEFRVFVRSRTILCMCQRELNHFDFLKALVSKLRGLIQSFYLNNLQRTFPDQDFVFDVYVPPPYDRVWLIDINPWAIRTDTLLFSWLEILTWPSPERMSAFSVQDAVNSDSQTDEEEDEEFGEEENLYTPEFRLVNKDDPEAYAFNTSKYSAHKLPKDVVDASNNGPGGLQDFLGVWREINKRQEAEDDAGEVDDNVQAS